MNRIQKKIFLVLKLLVTVSLCAFLIIKVNWTEIGVALSNANPVLILIAFALMSINVYLSSYRWKILLEIHDINFSHSKLTKYYFMGSFFNNFLPSTIGGDSYRIFKTFSHSHSKAGPVLAVIIERASGLLILIAMGLIGALISYITTDDSVSYYVVLTVLGLFIFLLIIFYLYKFNKSFLVNLFNRYAPVKLKKNIHPLKDFRNKGRQIWNIVLFAALFNIILVLTRLILLNSIGYSCNYFELIVVVMLSNLISLIPVSINGWGIRDGSFIYLLQNYGVPYEPAFIVMLLGRVLNIPLSLVGGIYYLSDRKVVNKKEFKEHMLS